MEEAGEAAGPDKVNMQEEVEEEEEVVKEVALPSQ